MMNPVILALALSAALAGSVPSSASDQAPPGTDHSLRLAAFERGLDQRFETARVPGAAMAVVLGGRVQLARGFGTTLARKGDPVEAATLFRLGSTTKMIVAATALVLAEQGRLDLHAPVSRYVPELPPRLGGLTLHQLLTHTAGMYDESPMTGPPDDGALGRMVHSWTDDAVFMAPGRFFSYSNPGYWLVGYVLEQVERRPFADVVKTNVLDPLGMTQSTFRPEQAALHACAAPHSGKGKEIRPAPNHAGTWPSGSLYSSAEDMSRFLSALLADGMLDGIRVLPRAVVRGLLTPRTDIVEPRGERYGYGMTFSFVAGETLAFHSGSRAGFGSYILLVPARGFGAITLANRTGAMLRDWHRAALMDLLGIPMPIAAKASASERRTLGETEFGPLLGEYENPPALRYRLFNWKFVPWARESGQLFSRRGLARMPVYQVAPDRYADDIMTFSFTRDATGQPRYLHGEYHTLVRRPEKKKVR